MGKKGVGDLESVDGGSGRLRRSRGEVWKGIKEVMEGVGGVKRSSRGLGKSGRKMY